MRASTGPALIKGLRDQGYIEGYQLFAREDTMSIIRLIHIKIDPSETETAERIWKTECATLMISQKGCISEKLLRARESGEFISYSEWETEADIERYMSSEAHKQIVSHTRSVKGASAVVKLYDLVN
jgi:heme-degrading monooxygenase HmoA